MKVLQFAFDSRDPESEAYMPDNYIPNCVAYTGTHDNDTVLGWVQTAPPDDVAHAIEYLGLTKEEGYHWGMMRTIWKSDADTTIVTAQDILGLGSKSRMNTPSLVGGNWRWRALPGSFTLQLAEKIREDMRRYDRLPKELA
jgi:4-alpha-glucanotransferase